MAAVRGDPGRKWKGPRVRLASFTGALGERHHPPDTMTLEHTQRLVKILGLTGSAHDGEALSALRKAQAMMERDGLTWADLLAGPTPDEVRRLRQERDAALLTVSTLRDESASLRLMIQMRDARIDTMRRTIERLHAAEAARHRPHADDADDGLPVPDYPVREALSACIAAGADLPVGVMDFLKSVSGRLRSGQAPTERQRRALWRTLRRARPDLAERWSGGTGAAA
jgi:hypothetical protein